MGKETPKHVGHRWKWPLLQAQISYGTVFHGE